MFRTLFKEPLLHFVVIGMALFQLYSSTDQTDMREGHIALSNAEITQLMGAWQRRWNRPPGTQDIRDMIESRVREEVLYREAISLGMDRGDPMVRRRLSQKMAFMFEDLTPLPEPDEETLTDFYRAEHTQFTRPARYSLRHIFFSRDRRGEAFVETARARLQQLRTEGEQPSLLSADQLLQAPQFSNVSTRVIGDQLGGGFVEGLSALPVGSWQGPVLSAFGAHLVYIEQRQEAYLPALADIRDKVLQQWQYRERRRLNEEAYQRLRQRYTVDIDWSFEPEAAAL
mgnify:CR=1 FL=1